MSLSFPTDQIQAWLGRPLSKTELHIFNPLERLRLARRPLRLTVADGELDSETVTDAILTYIAWFRHIFHGRDIMISAPMRKIARRYADRCRDITRSIDGSEPPPHESRLLTTSGRRPDDIKDQSFSALVILNSDLFPRRNGAFDATLNHSLPLLSPSPDTLLIIHGTYYRSHRTCPFAYYFRSVLAGHTDCTPVHTSDVPKRPRAAAHDLQAKAPRYYSVRRSRIQRLAEEYLAYNYGEQQAPILDGFADIEILDSYDLWDVIPKRITRNYPNVQICNNADIASFDPDAKPRHKIRSHRAPKPDPYVQQLWNPLHIPANPDSPLYHVYSKPLRDFIKWPDFDDLPPGNPFAVFPNPGLAKPDLSDLPDEVFKRFNALGPAWTINRCPVSHQWPSEPAYPAFDPHVFQRRRRKCSEDSSPMPAHAPEDDYIYLPVRDPLRPGEFLPGPQPETTPGTRPGAQHAAEDAIMIADKAAPAPVVASRLTSEPKPVPEIPKSESLPIIPDVPSVPLIHDPGSACHLQLNTS